MPAAEMVERAAPSEPARLPLQVPKLKKTMAQVLNTKAGVAESRRVTVADAKKAKKKLAAMILQV